MRIVQFNKTNLIDTSDSKEKPVVHIVRIVFNTNNPHWVNELTKATLVVTTKVYENATFLGTTSIPLVLGAYITPYIKQPVLELNRTENFGELLAIPAINKATKWVTTFEIKDLDFKDDESLNISIIEKRHIEERVEDWKTRITNLFKDIETWTKLKADYSSKQGTEVNMHEDLMRTFEIPAQKIETLDIFYKNKIVMAIKPKGLWTIAANGRIDVISRKGSYMIVDFAESFESPKWNIYTADKKLRGPFDQKSYLEVLTLVGA